MHPTDLSRVEASGPSNKALEPTAFLDPRRIKGVTAAAQRQVIRLVEFARVSKS